MKKCMKRHAVVQPLDTSYRFIALTKGQTATVDAADFDWLSQWNWHAQWAERVKMFYAARTEGGTKVLMHRAIKSATEDVEVDHKDHDGLNNRKGNLRTCTKDQNARNRKQQVNNTSGYKGVTWQNRRSPWKAGIYVNRKRIHLGSFPTKAQAAKAYDDAAKIHHGEFALTNLQTNQEGDKASNG